MVLLHPFALVVSSGAAVFLSVPSPVSCEKGSSSRELYASPESCRSVSGPLSSCDEPESRPSWGLACPLRGVSLARFLDGIPPPPNSVQTFCTSSTALCAQPCGFVSPRYHVQGSLFRGFAPHTAAPARRRIVPSRRWRRVLPTVARQRHTLLPRPQGFLSV